ncbi:hypothetical protein [Polymorphum gilvum]|nr:hypothetical protein [Polymorphum gilvum]
MHIFHTNVKELPAGMRRLILMSKDLAKALAIVAIIAAIFGGFLLGLSLPEGAAWLVAGGGLAIVAIAGWLAVALLGSEQAAAGTVLTGLVMWVVILAGTMLSGLAVSVGAVAMAMVGLGAVGAITAVTCVAANDAINDSYAGR